MECLRHFHRTRSHAIAFAKITSAPKKPRCQTLLSTFFQKDNMNLKHWIYFFWISIWKFIISLFSKIILRKRMVVIKREYGYIVLILIVLEAQILSGEHWKYYFQASKFQNFLGGGGMPPDPPRKLASLALEKQAAAYFPHGDVYFKTYWQHWLLPFLFPSVYNKTIIRLVFCDI